MRKFTAIVFSTLLAVSFAVPVYADITLTKLTETVTFKTFADLAGSLKFEEIGTSGVYRVSFPFNRFLFDGLTPSVRSYKTTVYRQTSGTVEERIDTIVLDGTTITFLKGPKNQNCSVYVRLLLANRFAETRDELMRFYAPQTVKGFMLLDNSYYRACSYDTLDILIGRPR